MEILEIKEKLQKVLLNSKFGIFGVNTGTKDNEQKNIITMLDIPLPSNSYTGLFIPIKAENCEDFDSYLKNLKQEITVKVENFDINEWVYDRIQDEYKKDEIPDYVKLIKDAIYFQKNLKCLLCDIIASTKEDTAND